MRFGERQKTLLFGALFGAWIGLVYSFVSQSINWLYLPGISITPPSGGMALYVLQYVVIGALLGLVGAIPESAFAGMTLGGLVSAFLLTVVTINRAREYDVVSGSLLLMSCSFMPLVVLLAPIALLIRAGVDAQHVEPDQPHLWARRLLIPLVLTIIAVSLGSLSLFSKEHRTAIRVVDQMIINSRQAESPESLPEPLLDVRGYYENARGPYSLTWSDRLDTFMGPRPAGAELSQFIVVARFNNGFSFACVFSSNRTGTNCVTY